MALPDTRYAEAPARVEFFRRLIEDLRARPEVRAAGGTTGLPLGQNNWWRTFLREGDSRTRLADLTPVVYVPVSGAYFEAMGIGCGLIGAVALTRTLSSLVFGVAPEDGATLATVLVMLTVVALLASWLPARNAARVSPMEALRAE